MTKAEKIALLNRMNIHCDCSEAGFVTCRTCKKAVTEIERDIEKVEKYRWHDLREEPDDLPDDMDLVDFKTKDAHRGIGAFGAYVRMNRDKIIAWKHTESFEEG